MPESHEIPIRLSSLVVKLSSWLNIQYLHYILFNWSLDKRAFVTDTGHGCKPATKCILGQSDLVSSMQKLLEVHTFTDAHSAFR